MIRVTVELVSAIHPSRNKILGIATISNNGQASLLSNGVLGDYDVTLSKSGEKTGETWKKGKVTGFHRKRFGGWDLLYLALDNILRSRHEK